MRIGFIGTGSMGNPVAGTLLAAGHDLSIHDRRPEVAENLLAAGATWRASPAEIARHAEVILLSLPSHVEVETVCFGPDGLFTAVQPGTYLIDLTTGSVSLTPRLVEAQQTYGIHYLASPVSQGVDNARVGKLSVFVGGDRADYQACLPIYDAIGSMSIRTGDQASALAAKLLTNLLWFVNAAAIGEALVIGAKSGIELSVLQQVVLHSCGTSWVAEHDIPSIYDGTYDPSFTTALCLKDLALVTELAAKIDVPIELGAAVAAIFGRAKSRYGGDSPELSVVRQLEEATGVRLQPSSERVVQHGAAEVVEPRA
jgi:3-hydroxyisobutyrate dehydrogenase-like beta-hydroxyacid dehydrogenase